MSWFEPRYHTDDANVRPWEHSQAVYGPPQMEILHSPDVGTLAISINAQLRNRDIAILAVSPAMPTPEGETTLRSWTVTILFQHRIPNGMPADEDEEETT